MADDDLNAVGGHCPVCGQEYRPGFRVCADDGADLVPGPAPLPAEEERVGVAWGPRADEPDPEQLARVGGVDLGDDPAVLGSWQLREALLIAGRLRSNGIPAMAERDHEYGPYTGADLLFQNLVRVFVASRDLDRARDLVRRIQAR